LPQAILDDRKLITEGSTDLDLVKFAFGLLIPGSSQFSVPAAPKVVKRDLKIII